MANPIQSLNENFVYNSMLARALTQLLPSTEKGIIRVWLDKLHDIDGSPEEMNNRNEYMWFLLLMLQNKKITIPFNKMPPTHSLRPLREILPQDIYEEVLTATDKNMSWLDQVSSAPHATITEPKIVKPETPSCRPSNFFASQPMPRDGVICYMAAFSDHYN